MMGGEGGGLLQSGLNMSKKNSMNLIGLFNAMKSLSIPAVKGKCQIALMYGYSSRELTPLDYPRQTSVHAFRSSWINKKGATSGRPGVATFFTVSSYRLARNAKLGWELESFLTKRLTQPPSADYAQFYLFILVSFLAPCRTKVEP